MVLGHGVSPLIWRVVTLGAALGCCLCWGMLQLGVEGFSSTWVLPVGQGIPSNFPCTKLYTVTGMDVAADITTGICVVAVEVGTVGVGTAGGMQFTGEAGMAGIGWAITLTLYLLLTGALALPFFSTLLGTKAFLVEEFLLWEGVLVHGCDWDLGLGPSLPSSSKYVFIFLIKDG